MIRKPLVRNPQDHDGFNFLNLWASPNCGSTKIPEQWPIAQKANSKKLVNTQFVHSRYDYSNRSFCISYEMIIRVLEFYFHIEILFEIF